MKTIFFLLLAALFVMAIPAHAIKVSYNYDAAGRMTAVNYDGTSRTAFVYDKNGSLLSRTNTETPQLAASPHLAGTYNGLITNLTPHAGNTGIITLKLLANGTFTGKLTVQGAAFSFAGKFKGDGSLDPMHIIIPRKAPLLNYLLSLTLDVQSGVPAISGTITGDFQTVVFNSNIAMQQDLYSGGVNLLGSGFVGKYTLLLQPTENTAGIPQSSGYATVVVTAKGGITLAGKLANNIAITQGTQLIGMNTWPVYVPLHTNFGYIAGNVSFFVPGDDHLSGELDWLKPATTSAGTFHSGAFSTELDILGSLYLPPAAGQRAMDLAPISPNAVFNAQAGNLAAPLTRNVTLETTNKFTTPVDAAALKLTLTAATGFITGVFKDTPTSSRNLSGVLIQPDKAAAGFFIGGATESGAFGIEAPSAP
jgi:YD repeat-containing protein